MCRACLTARGCKSSSQRDGREVIAKRKGEINTRREAEVMERVKSKTLRLTDAAKILELVTAPKARPHREPAVHGTSKPAPNHPWREGHEERRKQLLLEQRSAHIGTSASVSP